MSNPYDPYNNQGTPGDPPPPPPYGAPIPSQGGGGGAYPPSPYGQGSPYGDDAPKKTDAVSITGFVLSLTCCLSIVGAILGFIGLGRTKNNQRKGRWAAIAAIPVGIVGTIIAGLVIFGIVYAVQHSVTVDNAQVGQCVDVTENNNEYTFSKKECTVSHDAEIVLVGTASDYAPGLDGQINASDVCTSLMPEGNLTKLNNFGADLYFSIVIKNPDKITPSDKFLCYVEPKSGKLSAPLL